jgi:hypothetical protein
MRHEDAQTLIDTLIPENNEAIVNKLNNATLELDKKYSVTIRVYYGA